MAHINLWQDGACTRHPHPKGPSAQRADIFLAPVGSRLATLVPDYILFRWTPHPATTTVKGGGVFVYSYFTTITGWGVHLTYYLGSDP